MSDDPSVVAQRFARALEHLRSTWDLQYVGAAPVPRPEGLGPSPDEDSRRDASAAGESDPPLEPSPADGSGARSSSDRGSTPGNEAASSAAVSEATGRDASAPRNPAPPARPSGEAAGSPGRGGPDRADPSVSPASPSSGSAPAPIVDPAQRAEAAHARKEALREQAQQWSAGTKLEYLRRHNVGDCRRCPLSRTRNNIAFGVGNPEADVMFVGEAPGADEDRQGEPFVGRAGQLLNRWLEQLGMRRDDVYIANVLKCRPPGNRDPRPEEVDRCSPFLQAQIRAIEPRVIVALGRHAGMLLSRRDDLTLRAMRSSSRLQYDAGAPKGEPNARIRIPLVVTYHPAYVLRQEGGGRAPAPGRASPTEMVMTDLNRALSIARAG